MKSSISKLFLLVSLLCVNLSCRTNETEVDHRGSMPHSKPAPPRSEALQTLGNLAIQSSQILSTLENTLNAPIEIKKQILLKIPNFDAQPSTLVRNPFDVLLKMTQDTGIPKLRENELQVHWRWESLSGKRYFGLPIAITSTTTGERQSLQIEMGTAGDLKVFSIATLDPNQTDVAQLQLDEIQKLYLYLKKSKSELPDFEIRGRFNLKAKDSILKLSTENFGWSNQSVTLNTSSFEASFEYPHVRLIDIKVQGSIEYQEGSKPKRALKIQAKNKPQQGMELSFELD